MTRSRYFLVALIVSLIAVFVGFQSSLRLRVAIELLGWKGFYNVARESAASRILGARLTHSRSAYHRLLDALNDVDLGYCVPQRRVSTELDIAECHRLITHLISTGFRLFFESDLDRPHFEQMVGPRMKILGDNPDAFYYSAVFNPKEDYLVKGRFRGEVYLSFTIYESPCVGCFSQKVVADVNSRQLTINADGSYELIVSPKRKPTGETRNWISTENLTNTTFPQLITRHYYEGEICGQLDPIIRQELSISPMKNKPMASRMSDLNSAERFERVNAFVRSHTLDMIQDPAKAPSWFSFTPNVFGPAVLFRNEIQGAGAVDIVYSAGPFKFDSPDDQGLLITGVLPKCAFANIALWNRLLQTFSYETGRTVSLNRKQMKRSKLTKDLTGPFKILLSKRHPKQGLPVDVEWLDSEGREDGTMFWRFLLPDEEVETPKASLIQIDDLR